MNFNMSHVNTTAETVAAHSLAHNCKTSTHTRNILRKTARTSLGSDQS